LKSNYNQLPLRERYKVKTTFWGINPHGKIVYTIGSFLLFGLKNALVEFFKIMDQILIGFGFAKCYIDDIVVFSPTL
jgi:hypothetical protein